jgi:CRP-like cAMP-binding protein
MKPVSNSPGSIAYTCSMAKHSNRIHELTKPYLLHNAWVMADLPEKELAFLHQHGKTKTAKRGEVLFKAGAYPKAVYWLITGKVKIYQESATDQKSTNYIYSNGDLIAYRQLISNEPHPVTGSCLEDSTYMVIPADAFKQLLSESAIFSRNMLTALAQDFTIWMNRITVFSTYAVRERVILSLLILAEQYRLSGSTSGEITITRTELAEYVGATLETVVRVLNKLKAQGLVIVDGRKIAITSIEKLIDQL